LEGVAADVSETIARVLEGVAAEHAVDRFLRAHRSFSREQRAASVEAVFGVALWRRRLHFHLGIDRAPPALLLYALLRDLAGVEPGDAQRWLSLESAQIPRPRGVSPASLADRFSLPDWLADEINAAYGPEATAFAASICVPGPVSIRANRLKCDRETLRERLAREGVDAQPCEHSPDGLQIDRTRPPNLLGLPSHQEGWFETQDAGSQLVGLLVAALPGKTVLDYCAGAGGKSLLLAAAMANRGTVYVYDVDVSKLDRLAVRALRAGVSCIQRLNRPHASLRVDRVLVDAPCSELGILRRGPDARFRISPERLPRYAAKQLGILDAAAVHVRAGGRLVYATCTFRRRENEDVVRAFLATHHDFGVTPSAGGAVAATFLNGDFFTSMSHRHGTDGFFAAVLERQ
jgi:16S rRNA (cytosine967-C5)-methyltransferase